MAAHPGPAEIHNEHPHALRHAASSARGQLQQRRRLGAPAAPEANVGRAEVDGDAARAAQRRRHAAHGRPCGHVLDARAAEAERCGAQPRDVRMHDLAQLCVAHGDAVPPGKLVCCCQIAVSRDSLHRLRGAESFVMYVYARPKGA